MNSEYRQSKYKNILKETMPVGYIDKLEIIKSEQCYDCKKRNKDCRLVLKDNRCTNYLKKKSNL